MTSTTHRAVAIALVAALTVGAVAPAASAQEQSGAAEPSMVVEVQDDGDAVVTLVSTYNLTEQAEQDAFESLQNDQSARENATRRYATRLDAVAENANGEVDREMEVPVEGASIDLERTGDVGVVRLSATWTNLAAVEDGKLVVSEPFASGYDTDRPFVLVAPGGYELSNATPAPDSQDGASATWDAGTSLDGFEATMSATDGGIADSLPGFGVGAAALGAAGAAAIGLRRRRG
ncbi:hypothetical protein SAMN06269185_2554 [Natronoarchaeum philippinense]|uniref:DUF7345 domain-containing protein n=1 Tax=Natronoarchaeum philippinense TaxID=558529 RepID=A0A285P1S7_NATPI|nr:hypothetical protein [Natronoarchaeum philippinense]SNZ15670.1 hypothetical protein SAMN06269185_2554 [Natronoarchaeum philippinense]